MTEHDDKLSRRYRELAREEPSASLDATIRARARRRAPGHRRSWFVPVSIAAVLMLGVGVTLRMQMEQPGVETSVSTRDFPVRTPESAPPPAASSVDAVKPAEAPAPQPQPQLEAKAKSRLASPAKPVPAPLQERFDASRREEDAMLALPSAPGPIAPPAANFVPSPPPATVGTTATSIAAPAAPPPPAAANRAAPAAMRDQAAPAPQSAPAAAGAVSGLQRAEPQRAKQEGEAADGFAAKELKKSEALPDRDAELERIAKLRETGKHAEADRALEEFRKRYPDFRIPEAMWERLRPR